MRTRPRTLSGSWPVSLLGSAVLAVVLCREILEGREAVVARHVLLELLLERLEADAVLLVGAELGDVEAGRVRHVDHVGVGQHRELVLLRDRGTVRGIPASCKLPSLLPPVLHRLTAQFVSQQQHTRHTSQISQFFFFFPSSFF